MAPWRPRPPAASRHRRLAGQGNGPAVLGSGDRAPDGPATRWGPSGTSPSSRARRRSTTFPSWRALRPTRRRDRGPGHGQATRRMIATLDGFSPGAAARHRPAVHHLEPVHLGDPPPPGGGGGRRPPASTPSASAAPAPSGAGTGGRGRAWRRRLGRRTGRRPTTSDGRVHHGRVQRSRPWR